MKVLLISDGDAKYGAANALCQMAEQLLLKHDLDIIVVLNHESHIADYLRKCGCKVIIVHYELFYHAYPSNIWKLLIKRVLYGIKYRYSRINAIKELTKQINIEQFDLIHSNGSREDFSALISEQFQIPLIWHLREFGDRDYKCFSLRSDYIHLMNRAASAFIAVSNVVKDHWIKKGLDEGKIIKVYDGVRVRKQSEIRKTELRNKKNLRLVMIGSLQPTKGQEQAIKLMARIKADGLPYSLDLIGDGSRQYTKQLKELINSFGLESSINLLGYRTDVFELLPNYDIGLMCSRSEAFGLVTAEYMMAGLAVLASNTGANSELVRNGIDGYIYSYGIIEDMRLKLFKIIEENLGGVETYKYAVLNFTSIENADNIYHIYKSVVGS